jgi:hypothetical protein
MVSRWVLSFVVVVVPLVATACQVIAGLDDKTGDACVGRPIDALAAGATAFSGTCLADTSSAPDVKATLSDGSPPAAAGGTLEDGTYVLVTATIYASGTPSAVVPYEGPTREVIHVSGNQLFYVTQFGTDEPTSWWAMLNPSGTSFFPDPAQYFDGYRCPPVACRGDTPTQAPVTDERVGNRRPTYTATPNQLLLIYPPYNFGVSEHGALLTFERQR